MSDTPLTKHYFSRMYSSDASEMHSIGQSWGEQLERRLAAMTERAEKAERMVAWRSRLPEPQFMLGIGGRIVIDYQETLAHLASNPPDGWDP